MMWFRYLPVIFVLVDSGSTEKKKPHIIVIIADDMGFNDVGFHGSNQIPTPNIDALAYNGVILNSHYTQELCTPSRSAFLTGKYPIHLGMQHLVILEPEPWGLPLNETLLPQHLKRNGYSTHAIGKWHLGFFEKEYTPTYRGFDTHYGYWQGLQDYYSHMTHATYTSEYGYDMRRGMDVDYSAKGKYSTTLFTEEAVRLIREHDTKNPMFMYMAHLAPHTGNDNDPLQAPDEEIAKFAHIEDPERRVYAAMVSMLDKSVGSVIAALREKHMLENSIILFFSDNGAQPEGTHANHGSNYPFRGAKYSSWEGAQRNLAAIWSPLIKKNQRISNQLMHLTDWLPTFFSAAGLNKSELSNIDGLDMWKTISEGAESPRTELIYNIDDVGPHYGAIRRGGWKYIYGSTTNGKKDRWFADPGNNSVYHYDKKLILNSKAGTAFAGVITYQQIKEKGMKQIDRNFSNELLDENTIFKLRNEATVKCNAVNVEDQLEETKCDLLKSPCLFNIKDDPCERVNLASRRPNIVANLEQAIVQYRKTALPPRNLPRDSNADPDRWGGVWTNWHDCENVFKTKLPLETLSPLAITMISLAGIAVLAIVIGLLFLSYCRIKRKRTPAPTFNGHFDETPLNETNAC
ncbi:arylsulfatase B isoform X1 [Leptinotarsa decemlineata]|uniref:arylsulfatase B isoform X1 n=1 Tax=Leptinotarsa decemlineata TaxID=7539 RepID=UPI003D3091C8